MRKGNATTRRGAQPRRGRGRPSDYAPAFCDQLINFADSGLGLTAFAAKIGAGRSTIHLWTRRHPKFQEAMEIAAAKRQYRLERDVLELDEALNAGQVRLRLRVLARLDPENWRK